MRCNLVLAASVAHAAYLAPLSARPAAAPRAAVAMGPLAWLKSITVSKTTVDDVTRLMHPRKSISKPKQTTGTSYLPAETVMRADAGSKFEKIKLKKDTTAIFTDLYDYAAKIRAGELDWKDVEDADINTRFKWLGMLHRAKRNPGTFMMRLRVLNGIVTAEQMRFYADSVEPFGPDVGVIDI